MPIQTNCCQSIAIFHAPLPGSAKDAQRLRRAFAAAKLKKGKLAVIAVKDPIVHGKIYRGERIILQIANPLPLEVIGDHFWKIIGALIARTKEPWGDFCDLGVDWKFTRSHPHAHALSIWRVTRKGELKYLHYEDIDWDRLYEDAKRPNQSPEPTVMLVTPRAGARVAPSTPVAHL
jgi:hypothetical protein